MKPYCPSNKVPGDGLRLLILFSLVGGLATGGATFLVSRLIYLVVLFPLAVGAITGGLTAIAVRKGKVRNPVVAGAFALLTGLVSYGTMHYAEYVGFKQEAARILNQDGNQFEQADIDQFINLYLLEATGKSGFWGYIDLSAQEGVTIGRVVSSSDDGLALKGGFAWAYWLIELAIIEALAIGLACSVAKEPFCETSQDWYGNKQHLASIKPDAVEIFLNYLKADNYIQSGELLYKTESIIPPSHEVYLQSSPADATADFVLVVNKTELVKEQVVEHRVLRGLISPKQRADLLKAIDGRA